MASVNVNHPNAYVDIRIRTGGEGIPQVQDHLIRLPALSIVEYHQFGDRKLQETASVNILMILFIVTRIKLCNVLQHAQRHIRIKGRLLLEQIHFTRDQKRYVTPHAQIQDLVYCVDLNVVFVRIGRSPDCIIKAEGPAFTFLPSEQEMEEPVTVLFVCITHGCQPPFQNRTLLSADGREA